MTDDPAAPDEAPYVLEDQVGHLLRRAHQRASQIFLATIGDPSVTPMQLAALVRLHEHEPSGGLSQNHLGRLTAMDPATIQGVIRRLMERGLIHRSADAADRRRKTLRLTDAGRAAVAGLLDSAAEVSRRTLEPLSPAEQRSFLRLLRRLA
ncbi:MAG: MarR family winged helix-turn-helix transcriptional regulator [Alphaproteobacteria bacterium]